MIKKIASGLFVGVILAIPFLLHPLLIYGNSMFPFLKHSDLVLVERISTALIPPWRGEMIAFTDPDKPREIDIKRVIGLPKESVIVDRDSVTVIFPDGRRQFFEQGTRVGGVGGDNGREFGINLGEDEYFVLGDNRRNSADSRSFGPIKPSHFIGRVIVHIPARTR